MQGMAKQRHPPVGRYHGLDGMARACIQAVRPQTNLAGLAPLGVEAGKSVGISPEEPRLRKSAGLMNMIEGTRSPLLRTLHIATSLLRSVVANKPVNHGFVRCWLSRRWAAAMGRAGA